MKLTKLEFQKLIEPFNIVIVIIIILSVFMIYSVYNQGYGFELYNGEHYYTYKGQEYINNNKKYADQYSGRVVNDNFFQDISTQYLDVILHKDGEQNIELHSILISSLLQYYNQFPKINDKIMYGEISTDVNSVFERELPVFEYTDNWNIMRNLLSNIQLLLTIVAIIISSVMFSKEYSSGMISVILSAKNGRKTFALSKIYAFYMLISIIYIFVNFLIIIAIGLFWGFENPFADIRVITNAAYIYMKNPISCISLILLQFFIGYLIIIIMSSIGIFFSSVIRSPYISLIATMAVFLLPLLMKIENITSDIMKKIITLLPYNAIRIFSNQWNIFDFSTGVIYAVILIAVACAVVFLTLAVKIYSNHKVS